MPDKKYNTLKRSMQYDIDQCCYNLYVFQFYVQVCRIYFVSYSNATRVFRSCIRKSNIL